MPSFPKLALVLRVRVAVLAILLVATNPARADKQEARGWGSSWTVPQTEAEKETRDMSQKLEKAIEREDWPSVDRMLGEVARRNPKAVEIPVVRALIAVSRHRYDEALTNLNHALTLIPGGASGTASELYNFRAYVYQLKGSYGAGRADLEKAIALNEGNLGAHNSYAWVLATCPDARVRDGKKAVKFARVVNQKTGNKVAAYLDTLAAAEAEAGDFKSAIRDEERALSFATTERAVVAKHLQIFRSNQPLHTPPDPPLTLHPSKQNG